MEPPLAVVLLAGGSGSRARGTGSGSGQVTKVYLPVGHRRLLSYPLDTILRHPALVAVVLVVREEDTDLAGEVVDGDRRVSIVAGGPTRASSEAAGLEALAPLIDAGAVEVVAIHDGARPFATLDLLLAVVAAAASFGGAVPALPLAETVYEVRNGRLAALDSRAVVRVQTPQAFRAAPLLAAFRAAGGLEGADTAETVERFSDLVVVTVPGETDNIKLTYAEDLLKASELAARFARGRWVPEGGAIA